MTCQQRLRQTEKINAADDALLESVEPLKRFFDDESILGIDGRATCRYGRDCVVERNDSNDAASGTNLLDGRLRNPEHFRDVSMARLDTELGGVSLAEFVDAAIELVQPSWQSHDIFMIANEMHQLSEDVDPGVCLEWDSHRRFVPPACLDESERRDLLQVRALEARSKEASSGACAQVSMRRHEFFA